LTDLRDYQPTLWLEHKMTPEAKVAGLNNLESISPLSLAYMTAMTHDIYTKAEADARYARTPAHPSGRSDTGEGCGIDADLFHGLTLAQVLAAGILSKMIGMWGAGSIPSGWHECDGFGGTPNVQDRTPIACGAGLACGATGGSNSVTPVASTFDSSTTTLTSAQIPRHQHTYTENCPNLDRPLGGYSAGYYYLYTNFNVGYTSGNILQAIIRQSRVTNIPAVRSP